MLFTALLVALVLPAVTVAQQEIQKTIHVKDLYPAF